MNSRILDAIRMQRSNMMLAVVVLATLYLSSKYISPLFHLQQEGTINLMQVETAEVVAGAKIDAAEAYNNMQFNCFSEKDKETQACKDAIAAYDKTKERKNWIAANKDEYLAPEKYTKRYYKHTPDVVMQKPFPFYPICAGVTSAFAAIVVLVYTNRGKRRRPEDDE